MPFSIRHLRHLPLAYWLGFWSLTSLLLLSSGPVYAEWVEVYVIDQAGGATIYVDSDTIRRKGDRVTMWELIDFKTTQALAGLSFSSLKKQSQYDCAEEQMRRLTVTDFSGNMGNGEVVYTDSSEQKWRPVEPDSSGQALWKVACGKK